MEAKSIKQVYTTPHISLLPSSEFSLSQPLLRGSAWALTKSCFTLISLFETKNPFHTFKQSLNCRLVLSCIHSNSQEQMKMESNMTLIDIKPQTTTLWHNKPKIQPSHYFPSPLWDCTPSDLAPFPHSTLLFFCFLCTCSVGLKTRFMEIRDWLTDLLNQLFSAIILHLTWSSTTWDNTLNWLSARWSTQWRP